jgi:hypothetical protein
LPALFALAHLAFIASESALLHAALLFLFGFSNDCSGSAATVTLFFPILLAAHLAFAAALMSKEDH